MRRPWKRSQSDEPRADPERAKKLLEAARKQRPDVLRYAEEIREHARRNNFAENTFALDPRRPR